jgi:ribosomal protein S27AE
MPDAKDSSGPSEVIRNRAKCAECGDVIESRHRHDFVWCKCGSIAVDGGHDYIRCIGDPKNFLPVED